MAKHGTKYTRSSTRPLLLRRSISDVIAYAACLAAAFLLLIFELVQPKMAAPLRNALMYGVTPMVNVVAAPFHAMGEAMRDLRNAATLAEQNEVLRAENLMLWQWKQKAEELWQENQKLRELVGLVKEDLPDPVTARLISLTGGPFLRSALVNIGRDQDVKENHIAMTPKGLAGRVTAVNGLSARLLLLTDLNSRIPVFVGHHRQRAVLAGDNSAQPRLLYLTDLSSLKTGDPVVTSGDGGVFPPLLPVGQVVEIVDQDVRVNIYVNYNQLELVSLFPGTARVEETTSLIPSEEKEEVAP